MGNSILLFLLFKSQYVFGNFGVERMGTSFFGEWWCVCSKLAKEIKNKREEVRFGS